jgi:hypothetical protein
VARLRLYLPWLFLAVAFCVVLAATHKGAETWVAAGTLLLALATAALAVSTQREAQASLQEVEISRRALQAGARPLLVDAPRGVFYETHGIDIDERPRDLGSVAASAHVFSEQDGSVGYSELTVPVQNVGSGVALIERFTVRGFPIEATWRHVASQAVVPPGQLITLRMSGEIDPGDATVLDLELQSDHIEVELDVWYTDLAGEQQHHTRLLVEADRGRWRPTRIYLFEGGSEVPFADLHREILVIGQTAGG